MKCRHCGNKLKYDPSADYVVYNGETPDTYKKCELIICKTLVTEEKIVLED